MSGGLTPRLAVGCVSGSLRGVSNPGFWSAIGLLTVVNSEFGHHQLGGVRDAIGVSGGVEDLDVRVGTRNFDLHHRVRLGDTTVDTLAVPVLITVSDEIVSSPIDCHTSVF